MATVNLEGYDATTGKKVPVTTSDTLNVVLPSSALDVPVFSGNLSGDDSVEAALLTLDGLDITSTNAVTNSSVSIMDHFLTGYDNTGSNVLSTNMAIYHYIDGAGATINVDSNESQPCFGVLKLSTGATTNTSINVRAFVDSTNPANLIYVTSGLVVDLEWRFKLSLTTSVSFKLGLATAINYDTSPFMGLLYSASTGPNFMAHLSDTVTRYSVDTDIPADTSWHKFRLVYNKATDQALYYLDDVLITTQSTSAWVPADDSINVAFGIKNSTASDRRLSIDWLKASIDTGLGL